MLNVGTALERAGFLLTIPFPHSQPVIATLWDLWVWRVTAMASVAAGLVLAGSSVTPVSQTSLGLKVVTDARSVAVTRWEQLTPSVMPWDSVGVRRGWRGRSVKGAGRDTST